MSLQPLNIFIFAKTPGITPAKTRIAKDVGSEFAQNLYEQMILATEELFESVAEGTPWKVTWAVAESEARDSEFWQNRNCIFLSKKTLAENLYDLESKILPNSPVLFVGTDAPHFDPQALKASIQNWLQRVDCNFLLGPCNDGGFYAYGAKKYLAEPVWKSVPMSHRATYKFAATELISISNILSLPVERDFDEVADLKAFLDSTELSDVADRPHLFALYNQVRSQLSSLNALGSVELA